MEAPRRAGRPRASSREMLEEAAGELFLERGYPATSVGDITQRAGVSRSSFFNYFAAKSDLLWTAFDDRVTLLRDTLAAQEVRPGTSVAEPLRTALRALAADLPPEHVALAFAQAEVMDLGDDLTLAAARRTADVARVLTTFATARGVPPLRAEVAGTAWAGALVAAVRAWALAGAGRTRLPALLDVALDPVRGAFG